MDDYKPTSLTFFQTSDFWGYRWIGHCFYIESVEGDMLIGDGLPATYEEARYVCRCVNLAHSTAKKSFEKKVNRALNGLVKDIQTI